jgi:hypothetical protein
MKWHPTREEILELFDYDRTLGTLIWKNPPEPNRKRLLGKVAGTFDKHHYRIVMIKKQCFKVHRVVWFLETGKWPHIVDHLTGSVLDNRFKNLRDCNVRQNCSNTYRHRDGKLVGAHWHKRQQVWRSHFSKNGKQVHLGNFKTELEAHKAYRRELQNATR